MASALEELLNGTTAPQPPNTSELGIAHEPRSQAIHPSPPTVVDVPEVNQQSALDELLSDSSLTIPTVATVVETDAKKNEKHQQLSKDLAVSVEVVRAAPADAQRQARTNTVEQLLNESPVTKRLMTAPEFAEVAHPAVEDLTALEKIGQAFQRGALTRELGIAATRLRTTRSADTEKSVQQIKDKIEELGHESDGLISWLTAASEVVGQQTSSFASPEAAVRVGGGGAIGATVGTFGGPIAPATTAAGAGAGLTAGLVSHFAIDSFEVEGGLAYLEMIEAGVGEETASWISLGVGTINAALELGSATIVAKPVTDAIKSAFKTKVSELIKTQTIKAAGKRLAVAYGGAVTVETATEVAQEGVNILATELGKQLTDEELEAISVEEASERLQDIAVQTFKAMTVLALPGPTVNFVSDASSALKAQHNEEVLQRVNEATKQSKLTEVSPVKAGLHVGEVLKEVSIDEVFIPVQAVDEAAVAAGIGVEELHSRLGTSNQVDAARVLDGDVRVRGDRFAEHIAQTDLSETLTEHVRLEEGDMTAAEAREFDENGLQEEIERFIQDEAITFETPTDETVTPEAEAELAGRTADQQFREEALQTIVGRTELQLGLDGLFRSAREVGITNKEYETYLTARQRAVEAAEQRQEKKRLKAEAKRNSEQQQEIRAVVEDEVRENVNQRPVYNAFNAIGVQRLDRNAVIELLPRGKEQLTELPKQANGRLIYANPREPGVHPDTLAELFDFSGGDEMLFAMIDNPPAEVVVQRETDQRMEQTEIVTEGNEIQNAIESLHNDNYAEVLAFELNALRQTRKDGRLKPSMIKQIAKERIRDMAVRDTKASRFTAQERREAQAARRALRAGDRQAAAEAKFRQLLNFQMAQIAFPAQARVQKQRKYLDKFNRKRKKFRSLPVDYLLSIRTILSDFDLGAKLSDKKRQDLLEWTQRKSEEEGVPLQIPQRIAESDRRLNFQDMTLAEFEELHDTVKAIEKAGTDENKLLREEEARSRQEIVDGVVENVKRNLKFRGGEIVETDFEKAKSFGREAVMSILNIGSLTRSIDGFQDRGAATMAIERPYNLAMTEGYQPGQVGYTGRMKSESERMIELYSVWDKKERRDFRKRVKIDGVRAKMSHNRLLSVLLNSGNIENRTALIESGQFTEDELQIVYDTATEKDWNFVQSIWDYLGEFWPEISESIKRRQNVVPQRTEASSINTKFGTFKGGYFPLQYDVTESILEGAETVGDLLKKGRFGSFVASHTRNGHTKARVGSGKRPVKLDLFTLNAHVDQVVYDLEVGDAVNDIYKVLHHKDLKQAFADGGQLEIWNKMDLWLGDIVTGEMHYGGFLEKSFRHLRTGFVISKLGFNIRTALLQPFGIFQTAVQIGKWNTLRGLVDTVTAPQSGEKSIWKYVSTQSGFMRQRESAFNREIAEASQVLSSSLVERFTPGKSAKILANAAFFGIIKMQRLIDVMTWLGARRSGMEKFNGDIAAATEFADNQVARAQATGIFGGRTQLERGTASNRFRQTELVRAFVPLISYFMAKSNVAYERTKKTNFRNPGEVMGWATDMSLLYAVESILVAMLDDKFGEDNEDDAVRIALWETWRSLLAGVPFIRDVVAEGEGFRGGGIIGGVFGEIRRVWEQSEQGEVDTALTKSVARLSGTLLRVPGTAQAVKTGEAIKLSLDGEDVTAKEFVFGPRWDE